MGKSRSFKFLDDRLNRQFVELLEKSAHIYMEALATGRPVTVLPEKTVAQLHAAVIARQDREIARKKSSN